MILLVTGWWLALVIAGAFIVGGIFMVWVLVSGIFKGK